MFTVMDDNFVVMDCDMGADDAWALLTLINAETVLNLFKILAITTIAGNTNVGNVSQNVYRLLDSVNRTDIPIYKGSEGGSGIPDNYDSWFGMDGFGDVLPDIPPNITYIQDGLAIDRMYELASEHPKKVSFIMTGPLTNLAKCILRYKDFLYNVKDIWILGGNLNGSEPEYNFRMDAEAAQIVLQNAYKAPVYIVPLEPTIEANEWIDLNFRFDYLGAVDNPTVNMLNKVEESIFVPKNMWIANDAFLAAAFVFREKIIVKRQRYYAEIFIDGPHAGLMTLTQSDEGNVVIIEQLNADTYKMVIAWAAGIPDAKGLLWKSIVANKCCALFSNTILLASMIIWPFLLNKVI